MFRLTREVRFAVNREPEVPHSSRATNSYGGYPSLRGFGIYLALQVTLCGQTDSSSNYLVNIKEIDSVVRQRAIPLVAKAAGVHRKSTPEATVAGLFQNLNHAWPGLRLESLRLLLSPFLSYSAKAGELPMVRLSQKFEFSATHRLNNPALSQEENGKIFGKCNNPHGHGHNYELQVTLKGEPNGSGVLIDVPAFEAIVASAVIDRFDHKNLNVELSEFHNLIPTVENIACVIHGLLKPQFAGVGVELATVTVWETPKTWCEFGEEK